MIEKSILFTDEYETVAEWTSNLQIGDKQYQSLRDIPEEDAKLIIKDVMNGTLCNDLPDGIHWSLYLFIDDADGTILRFEDLSSTQQEGIFEDLLDGYGSGEIGGILHARVCKASIFKDEIHKDDSMLNFFRMPIHIRLIKEQKSVDMNVLYDDKCNNIFSDYDFIRRNRHIFGPFIKEKMQEISDPIL